MQVNPSIDSRGYLAYRNGTEVELACMGSIVSNVERYLKDGCLREGEWDCFRNSVHWMNNNYSDLMREYPEDRMYLNPYKEDLIRRIKIIDIPMPKQVEWFDRLTIKDITVVSLRSYLQLG